MRLWTQIHDEAPLAIFWTLSIDESHHVFETGIHERSIFRKQPLEVPEPPGTMLEL